MSFSFDSIPNLSGYTALVTGANGGLGLETAKAFAAKGARVIMAARDLDKAAVAEKSILAVTPGADLEVISLDLGSLVSIAKTAAQVLSQHDRIDILVNNAGLMALPEQATLDGFEMQFGVNHLGHWALTAQLMPALLAAPKARVVTVTSTAHHMGKAVDPKNPHLRGNYSPWKAYGQSKLANYHFAQGLEKQFKKAGVPAMSLLAHPGLSQTDLQSRTLREGASNTLGGLSHKAADVIGMSADVGAMPQLRAATDPTAQGGQFYAPRFMNSGAAVRRPLLRPGSRKAITTLWAVSERETGLAMVV
jgi:NAD(P)-dependent dehydrogenase (short-subunit alcohol dehydrogenase family)